MNRILIISALLLAAVFTATADRRRLMLARNATAATVDSPDDISGLFAWYKGDAGVTNTSDSGSPSNDDPVAWWGDSSGNGRHLRTNNIHGTTPLFKTAATISKSQGALQFSGTTNLLKVGFTALPNTTIFAVWRNASSGTLKLAMDGTNAAAVQELYKRSSDAFGMYSGTEQTTGAMVNPSWNKLCGVFNSGGNDSFYTNGVVVSTSLNAGSQSLDGLTVGGSSTGQYSLGNGEYLGEVIIYNRNLNSTEIGQVFTYLSRWD